MSNKLPEKSLITIDSAKQVIERFGRIYQHKTNKTGNMGVIRAVQFHFIDGFMLNTGGKIYIGEKGDFLIQHNEFFEVMKYEHFYNDYCEK